MSRKKYRIQISVLTHRKVLIFIGYEKNTVLKPVRFTLFTSE